MMRAPNWSLAFALLTPFVLAGSAACGTGPGTTSAPRPEAATGTVTALLSVVPTGVQCLQITVSPEGTTKLVSPGTKGWPATIDLGVLDAGPVTVDGAAYSQSCSNIWGQDPTWVADEVNTEVSSGTATKIALVFHQNPHSSGTVEFAPPVQAMAMGDAMTYALMGDGTVMYWGTDILDQKTLHSRPTPLAGISGATAIGAGSFYGCAIMSDTTVKCWGASDGTWSVLANGNVAATTGVPPTAIAGLTGVTQLAAAEDHICVLTSDQSVYCWGKNSSGAFADGTTKDAINAMVKSGFSGWPIQQIVASSVETDVLLADGTVQYAGNGQASTGNEFLPGVTGGQQVAAGYDHACAVQVDGRVVCWGSNNLGQLGNGTTTQPYYYEAVPVVGLTDAVQVAAYSDSTCAISRSGQVKCWGANDRGELGDGHPDPLGGPVTPPTQITPNLPVVGITTATSLPSSTGFTACAVLADSTVRCWGDNGYDLVGDGTDITRFVPVMPAF
jgi:alpha-tubulin suppressor-like RCC1 family protein